MKLSVSDRLTMLNLLPKEGTFVNLKLIRVAREELSFNEVENRALGFQQKGNQLTWDPKVVISKEINLDQVTTLMVADALKGLNEKGMLRDEHVSLYEKFVENTSDSIH